MLYMQLVHFPGVRPPDMALVYVQLYKKVLLDLQVHLASQHSTLAVIHRFKAKVMWYKKEEYRNLATAPSDTSQQKQCEDRLALIMAEYLFDAGYPVFVKAALKNLELDVLGLKHALLIEAKVSTTGTTKNHLVSGLAQTIAYLNAISGTPLHVDEAFYVVFRLDGILFEFPHIITTGRFTIYPVVIDVAKSTDGGSRTKHVTQVTAADIQKQLESHPRTRKQGA